MKLEVFFEEDGTYGGKVQVGNEYIYTTAQNFDDLAAHLREGIVCSMADNASPSQQERKLADFFNVNKNMYAS